MAWTDEARAAAAATRKAKAKHPAKGAKVAKALKASGGQMSPAQFRGMKALGSAIHAKASFPNSNAKKVLSRKK